MSKRILIFLFLAALASHSYACADTVSPASLNKKKLWITAGANAALWTGSFIALNKAWYADYPRTGFHFFNDNAEWNQMDKAGHVWTTYHMSRLSSEMWNWTGLSRNHSAILGGASGMIYQGIIELQDAYSTQWGFSWGDMGANIFGAGLYVWQETGWKEQRIMIKLGYWPQDYPDELIGRRNQLFGSSTAERILKDYNSQTYWASANLSAFFPETKIPKWLNIAVGYGAKGMYGGRINQWTDKEGTQHDYTATARERIFYLSPDIDLTRIKTQSRFLRSVFFILNTVKVPAPALELSSTGKFVFRGIKF